MSGPIVTEDGLRLEACWDAPTDSASCVVVLCHPHPLERGTMRAPLMEAVAATLVHAGIHVLRFNFRGVADSEGSWDNGQGEMKDVAAAVTAAHLAFPQLALGVAGWSFGATTSLRWQVQSHSTLPWVGIAPGILSYHGSAIPQVENLEPAPRLIIIGDRDQFSDVAAMQDFAQRARAELDVIPGSDHFFVFRHGLVGTRIVAHMRAAAGLTSE